MREVPVPQIGRTRSAILCADVHGYSRLMARSELRTQERVNRSIELIRSLIGDYHGRVASIAGDGVIGLFDSPPDALRFALTIQKQFRERMVPDDDPIVFRIGISHGDVFVAEGNVQGHSVNVAARIQALAWPGGICVTSAVRNAVDAGGMGRARPLGLKFLKNIDEPIEVFAIDVNESETAASSLIPPASIQLVSPVVAVEPFSAASGSRDETFVALAMAESMTQALSRFNWLMVTEDSTSGLVTPVLAGPAGTAPVRDDSYIVSGRLLRLQRTLRLMIKLREHPSGRIVWTEGVDLKIGRTFRWLDELAIILSARLERQVMMAEVTRAWQKPPQDLSAADYVMRAVTLMFKMSKESLADAEQLLRTADEVGPRSSRTKAMRAFAALLRIGQQWVVDRQPAEAEIDWLTRSALEAAPLDPLALALRGHVESFIFHRFERALDCFERALQSNPAEPFGWAFSAVTLSYLGRTDEALRRLRRYRALSPLDPYPFYFNTAFTLTHALAGQYEEAVGMGRRVLAENPNYFAAYRPLITSLAQTGAMEEARDLLSRLMANEPQFSIGWFRSKYPPLPGDQLERYLRGFREVGLPDD